MKSFLLKLALPAVSLPSVAKTVGGVASHAAGGVTANSGRAYAKMRAAFAKPKQNIPFVGMPMTPKIAEAFFAELDAMVEAGVAPSMLREKLAEFNVEELMKTAFCTPSTVHHSMLLAAMG